jgi:hypothetical protein
MVAHSVESISRDSALQFQDQGRPVKAQARRNQLHGLAALEVKATRSAHGTAVQIFQRLQSPVRAAGQSSGHPRRVAHCVHPAGCA